jgi:hypothetical protein
MRYNKLVICVLVCFFVAGVIGCGDTAEQEAVEPVLEEQEETIEEEPSETTSMPWLSGTYSGQLQNGIPSGKGTYTWTDGVYYEGEWLNGNPQGQGQIVTPDGTVFEVEFDDGIGTAIGPDNNQFVGVWEDGEFVIE